MDYFSFSYPFHVIGYLNRDADKLSMRKVRLQTMVYRFQF